MDPTMSQNVDRLHDVKKGARQARLKAWLAYHGIGNRELAEKLEVHPSMITRICKGERAPAERIAQLVELGIPRTLLPEPNKRKPGRPKKQRDFV
jgi:ribosome-binding protein aMBF1 (putative translation factor)